MKTKKKGIKAILVGESGVGKTSLINITIGLSFNESIGTTFSNSYVEQNYVINNETYYMHLWDTIGQEKYRQLTKLFFKDSKIVIFVYDKSIKKSFEELPFWNGEIKNTIGDEIIKAVVGNKEDLDDNENDVNEDEARKYAESINAKFRMTSAKLNPKGFQNFLKELLIDYLDKYKMNASRNSVINLNKKNSKKKNGWIC